MKKVVMAKPHIGIQSATRPVHHHPAMLAARCSRVALLHPRRIFSVQKIKKTETEGHDDRPIKEILNLVSPT